MTATTTKQQRAASAVAAHKAQRAMLLASAPSVEALTPTDRDTERTRIGGALDMQLMRQRAARILDEQRAERDAEREADAEAKRERRSGATAMQRAAKRPDKQLLAARRIDAYREALDYPMEPAEVLAAIRAALRSCGLSWETDESAHETIGIVQLEVMARLGTRPIRARLGRQWLALRVQRTYQRECFKRERATGLQASRALAEQWAAEDADDSAEHDGSGPDPVTRSADSDSATSCGCMAQAAPSERPMSALDIAQRLQLTGKQTGALALTLQRRKQQTLKLSAAERKAAHDALVTLRKRFPTIEVLRYALRPRRAILAAIDRCKRSLYPERPRSGIDRTYPRASWNVVAGRVLVSVDRVKRERPAIVLPDVGRFPLRVTPGSGPVWKRVAISSDPARPAYGDPAECSGPRPHRAASGVSAAGMTVHADPTREPDGWAFIRAADRTFPTRYRGAARNDSPPTVV